MSRILAALDALNAPPTSAAGPSAMPAPAPFPGALAGASAEAPAPRALKHKLEDLDLADDGADGDGDGDGDEDAAATLAALRARFLPGGPPSTPRAGGGGLLTPAGSSAKRRRTAGAHAREIAGSQLPNPVALLGALPASQGSPFAGRAAMTGYDPSQAQAPTGGLGRTSLADFALNYDRDAPVRAIDQGGADQEAHLHNFVGRKINEMNHGRSVEDAMAHLGLQDKRDFLPGLEVRLLDHQLVGVSWMLDQEQRSPYKGGILADDMGLGKTVQMIAMMALHPPPHDADARATLVVVPAALTQQWADELRTRANGLFEVRIHHGRDKVKTARDAEGVDVVITTYHTLNAECTVPEEVDDSGEAAWVHAHGGILPRTRWHRVVLDEAQFIRNRSTRSSRSVALLRAQYRWSLTGTPITNGLVDAYALLRFGRFRPWNDWPSFDEYIGKVMQDDTVLAGMRAQEVLKPVLLRRTKETKTADGQPLLQLPQKTIELVRIEFSKEEREIYDSVERKARIRINRFMKRGTLLKNNAAVLVMILRLRQLCCHPYLILSLDDALGDPTMVVGSEADRERARAARLMPPAWMKAQNARFLARAMADNFDLPDDANVPDAACPVCRDMLTTDSGRILECGHEMCYDCLMELKASALTTSGEVGHGERDEKAWEAAAAKGHRPCPVCRALTDLGGPKVFRAYAFEVSDDDLRTARDAQRRPARAPVPARGGAGDVMDIDDSDDELDGMKGKGKGKAKEEKKAPKRDPLDFDMSDDELDLPDLQTLIKGATQPAAKVEKKPAKPAADEDEDEDDEGGDGQPRAGARGGDMALVPGAQPSDATVAAWSRSGTDLEASSKMLEMLRMLKEADAAGDKTIVYSQWTSMLDLVETVFMRQGLRALRYDGKMGREARERTLREFRRPGGPRVILISIKCGGVGLNLVSANRVINLDLSWNYATESQAYDRVHRLGQDKEVFIKRLVVRDTLEDRMLRLQELKIDLADAALGEGSAAKLHKLSVKEIKHLFGFSSVDKSQSQNSQ